MNLHREKKNRISLLFAHFSPLDFLANPSLPGDAELISEASFFFSSSFSNTIYHYTESLLRQRIRH